MIEFVVIFLVVLSCSGVLFIVLMFLPKVWPKVRAFLLGCSSKIDASFADWIAEANRKRAQAFKLARERRRREQNHLRSGWDWNWLVASICGFLGGLFLLFAVGDWAQKRLKEILVEDEDGRFPVEFGGEEISSETEWRRKFDDFGSIVSFGFWIALPSLLAWNSCFWCCFLSSLFFCGGSLSAHCG